MSGTRAISTTSRRELSSSFSFFLQDKAPKEIHAILTETLACLLPSRAKDLSATLYKSLLTTFQFSLKPVYLPIFITLPVDIRGQRFIYPPTDALVSLLKKKY